MCKYCENERPLISNYYGWNLAIKRNRHGNPYLAIECVSGCTHVGVAINNCPMCGRKLGGDAE